MQDTTSQPTPTETPATTSPDSSSASQVESHAGTAQEGQEAAQETPEAKPFRPWEEDAGKEEQEPAKIPYSRFKEVNEERRAHQARVGELEAELEKFRSRSEELEKIKSPDDIKPSDYKSPEEFLKARDLAIKNAAIKEVEERFIARESQRLEAERNAQIVSRFESNVEEASKANPEIRQAVAYLDKYAHNLHPSVARELLEDENAGAVIHAITTNQEHLNKLFRASPSEAVRMIHKLSAKLDGTPSQGTAASAQARESATPPQALKPSGVPVTVKGGAGKVPVTTIKADTSMDDYRAWKAQQLGRKK